MPKGYFFQKKKRTPTGKRQTSVHWRKRFDQIFMSSSSPNIQNSNFIHDYKDEKKYSIVHENKKTKNKI